MVPLTSVAGLWSACVRLGHVPGRTRQTDPTVGEGDTRLGQVITLTLNLSVRLSPCLVSRSNLGHPPQHRQPTREDPPRFAPAGWRELGVGDRPSGSTRGL